MADDTEIPDGTSWNETVLTDAGTPMSTIVTTIGSTIPPSISQQETLRQLFIEFARHVRAVMGEKMDDPDVG